MSDAPSHAHFREPGRVPMARSHHSRCDPSLLAFRPVPLLRRTNFLSRPLFWGLHYLQCGGVSDALILSVTLGLIFVMCTTHQKRVCLFCNFNTHHVHARDLCVLLVVLCCVVYYLVY